VEGHDRQHGLPGEFMMVRCRACGLARTSPRPTPESMGDYYLNDYSPYVGARIFADASVQACLKALVTAETVFDTKAHSRPDLPVGRILQSGCEAARALGFPVKIGALDGIEKALTDFPERGGRIDALALFPVSYVIASLNQTGRMTVRAKRTGE